MSHFADYKLEREGKQVIERNYGFASYKIEGEICYIEDIYVSKFYREKGCASKMADEIVEIARNHGCTKLLGSVDYKGNNSHASLLVLLAYGMKLLSVENNLIYFIKDI